MRSQKVRVLVVDDSTFVQRAVERMLDAMSGVEIVGTAADGVEAVRRTSELMPDVILLDINMPNMDGLEALERIMADRPTPVIVMSTHTASGADVTMRALELGAVDFIDKSRAGGTMLDIYDLAPVLLEKLESATHASHIGEDGRAEGASASAPLYVDDETAATGDARPSAYQVVVVGASTGGPRALTRMLGALPADFPAPVVVAQHMPQGFTAALADRLNRRCALRVCEAKDKDRLTAGSVVIGPGGYQFWLERAQEGHLRVRVAPEPALGAPLPSVDVLFTSAAEVAGAGSAGVILTGMGRDGAAGLRCIMEAGGATLVESAETAVIYGMPREARGAAGHELPLLEIGPALVRLCAADHAKEREI